MREWIVVTLLCAAAFFVADVVWLNGKYLGVVKRDLGVVVGLSPR